MDNFLYDRLIVLGDVLASSRFEGEDTSACDYQDVSAAIGKAKAEVKMEIGLLLLELLVPEKKPTKAALKVV